MVPKTVHPREPNNFRLLSLTSDLMKTMEKIILNNLQLLVRQRLGPLQFTYQSDFGVDDTVIFLLHRSISCLEKPGSTVQVMIFDFSSVFNIIQSPLLRGKLEIVGVYYHLAAGTIDYLTNRPQYVRLHDCVSDVVVCSRVQYSFPFCSPCTHWTSVTTWATVTSRSFQMIQPTLDTCPRGMNKNTESSSRTLTNDVS